MASFKKKDSEYIYMKHLSEVLERAPNQCKQFAPLGRRTGLTAGRCCRR